MDDRKLILNLGGPAKVASLLGLKAHGGIQRVQNWMTRGIPPKEKLARPDLFLPNFSVARPDVFAALDADAVEGGADSGPNNS